MHRFHPPHRGPPHPWHPHPCRDHRGFRHRRRLFWRVYLHGILLLVTVAIALGVLGFMLGRGNSTWAQAQKFRAELEAGGPALLADREALDDLLLRTGERANADVTLYSAQGELLASNVDPPLPAVGPAVVRTLGTEPVQLGRPKWQLVMPVRLGGEDLKAYAVAEWRGPGLRHVLRGLSYVGGVLLALALASIPLVRTIVSPLERLTRAAQRLGSGDLSTRSGMRHGGEVGALARAFDEMAERLERMVRAERELLANVSHELRTPLSRIRVALELGAEGDAQKAQRYLKEIGTDLAELETLVEDVLTAARLDAQAQGNGFALHTERVNANSLVDAATQRFRARFPERSLEVDAPEGLPDLEADPVLLRRALDNLLDNARKYSEEARPVRLSARVDPSGAVRVEVEDEGVGMGEEELKQLFTPFFRGDSSRTRGTGGVGLGLALSRRIVEAHGGTLTVASVPGEGSTFTVSLPPRGSAPSGTGSPAPA